MKHIVAKLVTDALAGLPALAEASGDLDIASTVERTRDPAHGDFASNVAMQLAKPARKNPREIASTIVAALGDNEHVDKIEIAGPGFINFYMSAAAFHTELKAVLSDGANYGRHPTKKRPRILLEYISANPTGPLHVGHGRLAAYGATLGNILEAAGYPIHREYYVNDAGRQMDILGASVWLRWLGANGINVPFPNAGYRGDYIRDIAADIDDDGIEAFDKDVVLDGVPPDGSDDKTDAEKAKREAYIEAIIERAKTLNGEEGFDRFRQQALDSILDDIKDDLAEFGVTFDKWYSEQSLTKTGRIDDALAVLEKRGLLYKKDGATWFPATDFGDEKDRVVIRENGIKTYFASDIAYHFDKRERGFDYLIDVLGADHHGYISRVRGGLEAMGYQGDDLEVQLVQFVSLYRGGEKVQMSTRSGKFDTLRKLRAEVGNDAARFYYVMRSNDQPLDFDLDVATSQSNDNPVYYIQYAHARIARVFAKAEELDMSWDRDNGLANLSQLVAVQEKSLMSAMSHYPEVIDLAARNRAPQILVHYLKDLVSDFHSSYNAHKVLGDDAALRDARLALYAAVKIVVANGLGILGVSAPDEM
jgi:arginyl-tRNA synthetase